MHVAATNQRTNKVALVAGTRLVNCQASTATLLSADLLRTQTELPGKLGRASAIYINKISMEFLLNFLVAFVIVGDCGVAFLIAFFDWFCKQK